jgi:RNA polymerase sigma-70 factor (ECF subfamily)
MSDPVVDSSDTRRLLDGVRAGDRAAFERVFDRYRAELRRFIAVRLDGDLRARVDPSDVVQETQLEVLHRLNDFLRRSPMPFRVWLRRTAYERLLALRRQHVEAARRSSRREVPLPDHTSLMLARRLFARAPTASQLAGRRELVQKVRQVVARLPEIDREVLFMRNFEELPYEEIADILAIDPAAARKRHGRALVRFHELLIAHGITELSS